MGDNTYLKYGDLILLHVEGIDGYLSSQGFTNPNCFIQMSSFGSEVFCRNSRDFVFQVFPKLNYDAFKDHKQALKFYKRNMHGGSGGAAGANNQQLVAKGEKANSKGKERKESVFQAASKNPNQKNINAQKQQQERMNIQKKIMQLNKKLKEEEEQNRRIIERRRGEHVQYGSEIQLLHVDSEDFICAKKTCAEIDKTCNKVELSDHGSQGIYFKVMPRYKFRQEGEKILYGDQIVLLNIKCNLYLHITDKMINIEQPLKIKTIHDDPKKEITPVIIDRRMPPITYVPLMEVNVSTSLSRFRAVPFCQFEEDDRKFLRGGTVVRLQHSEFGGYLCSDDKDFTDDGLAEVFLWSFKGKTTDVENFNTASLFEVELVQEVNKGQICRESSDKEFNHCYRLRHLNTGRLVTVQEIEFAGQKIVTLGLASHIELKKNPNSTKPGTSSDYMYDQELKEQLEAETLFYLISTTIDSDTCLKNQTCVQVQHAATSQYLTVKKKAFFTIKNQNRNRKSIESGKNKIDEGGLESKLFQPIEDNEINSAYRHVFELKPQAGYEDAFFIQIVDKDTLKDLLFVHTSVGILRKNIPYLCNETHELPKDKVNALVNIMSRMNAFAKGEDEDDDREFDTQKDDDPFSASSSEDDINALREKIVKRQKIMRELYVIEYLVQILYYPFASGVFDLALIKQGDSITRICSLAYELLESAVGGYTINEMYASQWINFFFMQAMRTNNENDIKAQSTVQELLSDNKKLLEVQITPKIIKQFIMLCKTQEKHKRLIKLLTALCTCFGLPIAHNQNDIVKFLLEDKETRDKLLMPIRSANSIVEVQLKLNQYVPIQQLKDISETKNDGRIYKYFLALVELGADLNIGRNHTAYSQVAAIFPFEAVLQIIYDNSLGYDMRSYFVRLANSLFLDREPLEPLQIPTMTTVLNEIPNFIDLLTSTDIGYQVQSSKVSIPQQLIQLRSFILNYLRSSKGQQNIADKQKNRFTYWIIQSLYFMITHGFYKNQSELNELALPLIQLLDGTLDVYYDIQDTGNINDNFEQRTASDRYKYNKENEIILKSKKIQCDCLVYISQLELDGRTQLFLSKVKKDFEKIIQIEGQGPSAFKPQMGKAMLGALLNFNGPKKVSSNERNDAAVGLIKVQSGRENSRIENSVSFNHGKEDLQNQLSKSINSNQEMHGNFIKFKLRNSVLKAGDEAANQSDLEFLETVSSIRGFETELGDIYVCILFDLMLYKYPELNQTAFELLVRYFNRKRALLESISSIQILESKQSIDILNKVKIYQNELKIYQSEADVWMNKNEKSALDQKVRTTDIFLALARYCSLSSIDLTHVLKSSASQNTNIQTRAKTNKGSGSGIIDNVAFTEEEPPEKLRDILDKLKDDDYKQSIDQRQNEFKTQMIEEFIMFAQFSQPENKENQRIMRNFELHELAIFFIKYRVDQADTSNDTYINLIKQCYKFLIRFVRGNKRNQTALRDSLDIFVKDINDPEKYFFASRLVYEIFKDNKHYLKQNVTKILKQITNEAEEADLLSSKKASLLKLLTGFCKCKHKIVRANQQDIMLFLTEQSVKSSVLYLFSNEGYGELTQYINTAKEIHIRENFNEDTQSMHSQPTIQVSNQIFNIMCTIELLAYCCEGKSDLAEQKCQQEILQIENCYKILEVTEYFWPFKKCIASFVVQCYLDTSNRQLFNDQDEVGNKNIWLIAEILINDLINITENLQLEEDVVVKYPSHQLKTLKQEAVEFIYEAIIPFFRLILRRKRIKIHPTNEKVIAAFGKFVAKLYYLTKDTKCKKHAYQVMKFMHESPDYSKYLDNLKHPLQAARHGKNEDQEEEKELAVETIYETLQENSKSSKLSQQIFKLQQDPELKYQMEKEFEQLVLWITNIDSKIKEVLSSSKSYSVESFNNLSFQSIVSAILQMLDKRQLSKELHIAGLTLIRKVVEIENKEQLTPAADWDTDEWVEFKEMIKAKQDALVQIGCVKFLCKHISELEDEALLEEALLCSISLLLGGNAKTQEAFLNYFQQVDEQNRVLSRIKQMLMKQFDNAKTFLAEKYDKVLANAKKEEKRARQANVKAMFEKAPAVHKDPDVNDSVEQLVTIEDETTANNQETQSEKKKKDEDDEAFINQSKFQSVVRTIRILRFLQLLTENHYTPMQNFLREQQLSDGIVNPKSFDFVAFISSMLSTRQIQYPIRISRNLKMVSKEDGDGRINHERQYEDVYSCNLGYQMVETLTEFIQGPCKENQRTLVTSKVIDNCRDLISSSNTERELLAKGLSEEEDSILDGLKSKAVKLLLSIIEGPIDREIIKSITISLDDFVIVFERLQAIYNEFVRDELNLNPKTASLSQVRDCIRKETFDDFKIIEGFDLFILTRILADCYISAKEIIESYTEAIYYQFFAVNTGYIEILVEGSELQRVYFPIKPVCRFLSKTSRQALMLSVDRQSPQQKIIGLLKAVPDLVDEMEHSINQYTDSRPDPKAQGKERFFAQFKRFKALITQSRLNALRDLSTLIAVAICILILINYRYDQIVYDDGTIDIGPYIDPDMDNIIGYLGYIQMGTSLTLLVGWMINKAKLIIRAGWRNYIDENRLKYSHMIKNDDGGFGQVKAKDMTLLEARILLLTEGPEAPEFQVNDKLDLGHWILKFEYLWTCSSFVFRNGQFQFLIIYICLSFLGVYQSPVFYSFQVLDIINRFSTLRNVIQAVTLNKNQLLLTAMLELIIIYIYAVLGFSFFYDQFFNDDIVMEDLNEKGDSACQNLFHCYISTINFGLRAGGGIGEFLPPLSYVNYTNEEWFMRVVYDLTFFLIVIIMFFNIIFGIIIDTFAELRDNKRQIDEDMRNNCFICNIDRQTFERDSDEGFMHHIKKEHNLWQYLFFIIHLKTKDKIDYNGTESYIHEKLQQEDISWFPLHSSICLEKEKYTILEKVESLDKRKGMGPNDNDSTGG